ncbi:ABC transporter ATP-binding protein, partial [bacterium]|nr:ABC transporter ATP-binding protein [bacterium]
MTDSCARLSIDRLNFQYDQSDWRLSARSICVNAGEIVAVIGPNGSGKSTLLRLACGVIPSKADIKINGNPLKKMERREIARHLAYLPQDPESEYDYLVNEIVALGRYAHAGAGGFLSEQDCKIMQECMRSTEIDGLQNRRISQLSGGEKRRVFLASVLAQEPMILLLDEPTTALDPHHQIRFFHILIELAKNGITVLAATHDINLASHFCKRILLMDQGEIVADGTPDEVLTEAHLHKV